MPINIIAMKIIPLSFVWCVSLICSCATVEGLGILFWVSLAMFAAVSVYIGSNGKRLSSEVDQIFGVEDKFND